jgi:hypothetical protein
LEQSDNGLKSPDREPAAQHQSRENRLSIGIDCAEFDGAPPAPSVTNTDPLLFKGDRGVDVIKSKYTVV